MRKTILVVALVVACGLAGGIYWWGAKWVRARLAPAAVELRATQQDEDAAPAPEPSVSVQVNGREDAVVAQGGPLSITVAATQRHAVNVESRLRLLRARAQRPGLDQQSLQRTQAAVAALEAAVQLRLGDSAHPWTQAVQVTLRPLAGGAPAAPWALRMLTSQGSGGAGKAAAPGQAVLDGESSAEVHFTPEPGPWAALQAGQYEVRACLTASGEWKGEVCAPTTQLTVVESEALLTTEQHIAVDHDAARVALLAKDWAELERRGKALLARDQVAGQTALGDASFGRKNWDESLNHYTAARAAWSRKNSDVPRALNIRISQLLKLLGAEE
jgi:hypothetical protein